MIKPVDYYEQKIVALQNKHEKLGEMDAEDALLYQELQYRFSVMKTLTVFFKAAPLTTNLSVVGNHFQQVKAFLSYLVDERQYAGTQDKNEQNTRESAHNAFVTMLKCLLEQWIGFRPDSDTAYRVKLTKLIITITTVWIQYRNVYLEINPTKEELS